MTTIIVSLRRNTRLEICEPHRKARKRKKPQDRVLRLDDNLDKSISSERAFSGGIKISAEPKPEAVGALSHLEVKHTIARKSVKSMVCRKRRDAPLRATATECGLKMARFFVAGRQRPPEPEPV
jgi:hypothetical protein